MPADQAQRSAALDTARSFIVQAPAGSGKTELLVLRYLKLLSLVDQPERVLAITFTRKATLEMKSRVLERLLQAAGGEPPAERHAQMAVDAARGVLKRDEARGWNVLDDPGRLRISTIDSLCFSLLAGDVDRGLQWAGIRTVDDANELYVKAVRRFFEDLEAVEGVADQFASSLAEVRKSTVHLLVRLGGSGQFLESLLVEMLKSRTLWQRHLTTDRGQIEALFRQRQESEHDRFVNALGACLEEVIDLALQLGWRCDPHPDILKQGASIHIEDRVRVLFALSRLLCTANLQPRKPGGIRPQYFRELDSSATELWKRWREVQEQWHADPLAHEAIRRMAVSPPLDLTGQGITGEDSLLDDACRVLAMVDKSLEAVMQEEGVADFAAVANAALEALGSELEPTELLLAEDNRIDHILMDEFQDTSYSQYQLINRLTAGWQADDGRTLFLVGDPMQSIYRFREADVGYFAQVAQAGRLGQVRLDSLQLQSNFRSGREIIDWINRAFPRVFPPESRVDTGQVSYTPFVTERGYTGCVEKHVVPQTDTCRSPFDRVAELVVDCRNRLDNPSIGILLRARNHAGEISESLTRAGIRFEGVNMVTLAATPVVQDLMILTRAIMHPLDRVAWTSLLRAPCCGLNVRQLAQVIGDNAEAPVLDSMQRALDAGIPEEASRRVSATRTVMQAARDAVADPLWQRVERAWRGLGGPGWYMDENAEECAERFLGLIEELLMERADDLLERLDQRLETLYAPSRNAGVKLMTIHSAKGLEFDVVIVPELDQQLPGESRPLLSVQAFAAEPAGVLMAAITPKRDAEISLYRYLTHVDRERAKFEWQRLLYVACTRARRELHLVAGLPLTAKGQPRVSKDSFLNLLAPEFQCEIDQVVAAAGGDQTGESTADKVPLILPLLRLRDWPPGDLPKQEVRGFAVPAEPEPLPDAAAVALGSVLHRWLELIHDHFEIGWDENRVDEALESIRTSLLREGAPAARLDELTARCVETLKAIIVSGDLLNDISEAKSDGASWSELPIIEIAGGKIRRHVLDRLWQDSESRFHIVDYKTRAPPAKDEITTEKWENQLERYRSLIRALEPGAEVTARIVTLE